ncbi:MAG: HAMP domain-containing sensor histidine kinase [Pseudomonadota bacterium]
MFIPRIATTLALAFAIIALMHVVAVAIGWYGYRMIEAQQSTLTDVVLPVSSASQQSADRISQLQLLAPTLPAVQGAASLRTLDEDLHQLIDGVRSRLGENGLDDDLTNAQLASVAAAIEAAVGAQKANLEARDRFETAQARALGELEQLRIAVEVLESGPGEAELDELRIQEFLRAIADWRAQLLALSALREAAAIGETSATIRRGIRQSVRSLSRRNLLSQSGNLPRRLMNLLDDLTSPRGPFAMRMAQLEQDRTVQAQIGVLSDTAAGLAGRLSELVDDQNARAAAASRGLARTLSASETALFAVSLAALLLSALFTRQLVFRGVVEPMAALADRTTALADGDLDSPVPDPRFAELRSIAQSLLSFQQSLQRLAQADETLRAQNEKLSFANDELNRFAYAASHDLRSPLRGVKTLASFIREDFEGPLPDAIEHHMARMETRLNKMEVLLEDLLSYSRAGNEKEPFAPLSMREAVNEAQALLSREAQEDIRWEGPLDVVQVPPQTTRQTLRNLIDNSIKHHDGREPLQVRIRARHEADRWTLIEVVDNGPGIPPAYRDRVLQMFQTLKSASASRTSGLGLPMVQRMVKQAGGRITLLDGDGSDETSQGTCVALRFPREAQLEAESTG